MTKNTVTTLEKTDIQLGYIPLLDCIAVLWAEHKGYFQQHGLNVTLVREASWASLRDRLAFGILDAAHCLSAMLPATMIGTDQVGIPFQTSLVLSRNSTFISLNQKLCYDVGISLQDSAQQSAQKLAQYMQQHPVRLAQVFGHSIHHYVLRNWLSLADATLAEQTKLWTVPPPYMVDSICNHVIDGFCVGEPWHTQGELIGKSQLVVKGQDIIPNIADKVFAVTQEWAKQHPNTLHALTSAIQQAQKDLIRLAHAEEVWQLLVDFDIIQFNCSSDTHVARYHHILNIIQNFIGEDATPQQSDFKWLIQQMSQWDHLNLSNDEIETMSQRCIDDA
ncbi:MAG: ABC transporter substrate-binding protein [Acinetobacter sp.]